MFFCCGFGMDRQFFWASNEIWLVILVLIHDKSMFLACIESNENWFVKQIGFVHFCL